MNIKVDEPKYIVVVGASAGGLNSVVELCLQLTKEVDAAVFVVLHLSQVSLGDVLVQRLQRQTSYTCKLAVQDEPIRKHYLYMAVPDQHLIVQNGRVRLGQGPPENRWRPSIDVLFRSAAAAYNSRVIGIIMTGMLQDGTAGMLAVKRCGGTCIVQDPNEAEYPDMPLSVLNSMEVDYCISLADMGAVLLEKTRNGVQPRHQVPADVAAEAAIAERVALGMDTIKDLGEKSGFVCPDCGGGLWEIKEGNITRYRCYTGHAYTQAELLLKQNEALEETLWVALRMMEERKSLLEKMSAEEHSKGWSKTAAQKSSRAVSLELHIDRLKQLLFDTKGMEETG
ncbi:chemotaxis protein CheB [Paraflavisolibacter sp. H34]|uniref:chemotaxis protein CheB n=1 Tax=Huijunlia imazamoxiresistens TaxID=3127457 RepID=UPI00301714AF